MNHWPPLVPTPEQAHKSQNNLAANPEKNLSSSQSKALHLQILTDAIVPWETIYLTPMLLAKTMLVHMKDKSQLVKK